MIVWSCVLVLALLRRCAADPCAGIRAHAPYSAARIGACLHAVPFDAQRANATLAALDASLALYAFAELARAPPDTRFAAADVRRALAALRRRAFPSALAFHLAVAAALRQLRDAHTHYVLPPCFAEFAFYAPLPLVAFRDPATAVGLRRSALAVVSPRAVAAQLEPRDALFEAAIQHVQARLGDRWSDVVDQARVTAIDGAEPLDALAAFADTSIGVSKALNTRLKMALTWFVPSAARLGLFTKRHLGRQAMPPESVHFELNLTSNQPYHIDMPVLGFSPNDLVSARGFANYCGLSGSANDNVDDDGGMREEVTIVDPSINLPKSVTEFRTRMPRVSAPAGEFQSILNSTNVQFYFGASESSPRTLALWMGSFSIADVQGFADAIIEGFGMGKKLNADHLIMDFTANGGGNICIGQALVNYTGLGQGHIATDMPRSELADALAKAYEDTEDHVWSPPTWEDEENHVFRNASWLIPGRELKRGQTTRRFSQLLHLSDCTQFALAQMLPPPQFLPRNITIVTHGYCGSTCACTVLHAKLYDHVKTVVVGVGSANDTMITSFPGGQVFGSPLLKREIALSGVEGDFVPNIAEMDGAFRLAGREIYGPKHDIPLEFKWQSPDRIIYPSLEEAQKFGSYWKRL